VAIHPPAREPELRPGLPMENLPRGPRTAQESQPASRQPSGRDRDGPDLTGTGRPVLCIRLSAEPGLSYPRVWGSEAQFRHQTRF
jgi:hypothetical protein